MRKILSLTLAVFLTASVAQAISKIGGSKIISPDNGFSVEMPEKFSQAQQIDSDRIRLVGPAGFTKSGFQTQLMEVNSYQNSFTTLTNLDRSQTQNYFTQAGMVALSNGNPCIEAFTITTSTAASIIATWGQGKGITIMVVNTFDGLEALEQIYQSLSIDAGACSW